MCWISWVRTKSTVLGLEGTKVETIVWPFIAHLLPGRHGTPAQQIYVYSLKTHRDKWGVLLRKSKASLKTDKMPCIGAKSLLAAAHPNLISALEQRVSKGVISVIKNAFCVHQGAFRPGREKGITKCRNWKIKCLLVQLIVSCFVLHILGTASSHLNTKKGSNHGKYSSQLIPTTSPSSFYCLSFLLLLTQRCWLPVSWIIVWWSGSSTQQNKVDTDGIIELSSDNIATSGAIQSVNCYRFCLRFISIRFRLVPVQLLTFSSKGPVHIVFGLNAQLSLMCNMIHDHFSGCQLHLTCLEFCLLNSKNLIQVWLNKNSWIHTNSHFSHWLNDNFGHFLNKLFSAKTLQTPKLAMNSPIFCCCSLAYIFYCICAAVLWCVHKQLKTHTKDKLLHYIIFLYSKT